MGITVVVFPPPSGSSSPPEPPLSLSFDAPRLVIGRSEGCEIRLPDRSVSARHATIRQHGGSYLLVDEGSSNGTIVDDVLLAPHTPRIVAHGDRVRVGRVRLELRLEAVAEVSSPLATRELAISLVQRALARNGDAVEPRIVVVEGPDAGRELALLDPRRAYVVGRGNGADLMLDEPDASRKHLEIARRAEFAILRDLGSKNGTFVDDLPLAPGRDTPIRPGDRVRIGQTVFTYENAAADALVELEHASDELVDPPTPPAPTLDLPPSPPPPSARPRPALDASRAEPHAEPQARPFIDPVDRAAPARPISPLRTPEPRSGWGPSDLVIVALALAVLGLSGAGMYLLFRG